jgi:hypothetical protein
VPPERLDRDITRVDRHDISTMDSKVNRCSASTAAQVEKALPSHPAEMKHRRPEAWLDSLPAATREINTVPEVEDVV